VPGGVGSDALDVVANEAVFTEGVRLCRVRYEADLGNSGLGCCCETGESFDKPAAWYEDRRLMVGE
jgi:hypothetical protein